MLVVTVLAQCDFLALVAILKFSKLFYSVDDWKFAAEQLVRWSDRARYPPILQENLTVPLAEFICSLKFGLRCKVRPFHLRDVLR